MRWTKPLFLLVIVIAAAGTIYALRRPAPVVNAPPRPGPIMALGDSLTAGYGASAGMDYPTQLAEIIGRPVINCGVSRETVAQAARRLQTDVINRHPGIVIVLLGGNDLLQQKNLDQSFADLKTLVQAIQSDGAIVVLVGLNGLTHLSSVADRYKKLASETGCLYVPNILHGILGQRHLMRDQVDGGG